jgi:uncharacterized protein YsxB (DUF464 family)
LITATFTADKESGSIILRLTGHAGAAQKGHDVVCAGASMLAYTLAQVLTFMYEESSLHKRPHLKLDEGDTLIVAKPVTGRYNECLHAFYVIQVGYALLAKSYPQFVELFSFGESEEDSED